METIANQFELLAQKWLSIMLTSSIQLSIFLMLIVVISFFVKKQSATFLYMLWMIGLFKVLLPTNIKLPDFLTGSNLSFNQQIPILTMPEISAAAMGANFLSYKGYLFCFWIVVVTCLLVLWLYRNFKFNRLIQSCQLLERDFGNQDGNVRFFVGEKIKSPFTKGLFSPKIYLPQQALSWPEAELQAVIMHELAHIKRKDTFFIAFQNVVQILYFFHPLVWFANLQVFRFREKACDDFAIQSMHGNFLEYSNYLLKSLNRVIYWQPLPVISNYFFQSRKSIFKRFEYILSRKENVMIKLNFIQKLILVGLLGAGIALSCQKKTFKQDLDAKKAHQETEKKFVEYDTPPTPVGGFKALGKHLVYPELARKAGIEGKVMIEVKINLDGSVTEAKVLESLGESNGCDEAAILALKSVKWKPALKDDKPVTCCVNVPLLFKLKKDAPPKKAALPDGVEFIEYDEPPKPIGGFAVIQRKLHYPELARKEGIEGKVVVATKIGVDGDVVEAKIQESLGENNGCDEAAIKAIKSVKWTPAKKKEQPVAVWVAIPVAFKLK